MSYQKLEGDILRRYKRKSKYNIQFFIFCTIISLLICISILINISLRPIIHELAIQVGKQNVSFIINDTVSELIENNSYSYDSFVSLNYNDSGYISSVEYDFSSINKLKLDCNKILLNKLKNLGNTKIKIPFGSLIGDLNASGRGPNIRIKLAQVSVPDINVISTFESVGINQTKHEIRLVICAYGQIYLPPEKNEFSFTQEFVLAQTIIVGNIPSGYVDLK